MFELKRHYCMSKIEKKKTENKNILLKELEGRKSKVVLIFPTIAFFIKLVGFV